MEKTRNTHSSVILSKTKDGYEKILFNISSKSFITFVCSFLFSGTSVFSSMSPFGIAFYTSVFTKDYWLLNYIISCISVFVSDINTPWVYIASLTLVTALLGVVDFNLGKFKLSYLASLSFFVLKICFLAASGFIWYDFFALIIETGIIFVSVFVFQKSFPVIASVGKRSFISTQESICTMSFFALISLALSEVPSLWGFNISNVLSILMIYIFALGGINGGAVVLGVLLGTVGSLKTGSFAEITSSFSFGALLASAFCSYGKLGVILGFVIANTASSLILADAGDVAIVIFDSLAAAFVFAIVPKKLTSYFSALFSKFRFVSDNDISSVKRIQKNIRNRLGEMSRSFRDLSEVYASSAPARELGKEYIMSKFKTVTDTACIGCPSKSRCFKGSSSKGYHHMSKMLGTAFKNGKISASTMPVEFKSNCRRCDSFAEKFNAMFDVIKTEKQWLSKLNDSRRLVSDQLSAVADTLDYEKERCSFFTDHKLEENLWAEFDKSYLYPSKITAEYDDTGGFFIEISYNEKRVNSNTLDKSAELVSSYIDKKISCASPKRCGENVVYTFYPAQNYTVTAGYATKAKNGEKISGDSFTVINTDGRTFTAVLSDGMGSGEKAACESKITVTLMEKFLRAGFDSDTAVRLINSSLLLKSSRDTFSTIDLCTVNLADASLTFTKLGAANSYIKSGDKITGIKGSSLPAGILREIEIEKHLLSIDSDTVIILMSDGVADIALKNAELDGWIEKELQRVKTSNPQIMASKLMETALKLQGNSVHDDMTVIAINVKKV